MTKRLRKSRDDKEDAATTRRLEDELESTKSVDCHVLATYYLRHSIWKAHKQLAAFLDIDREEEAPHRDESDATKNVVGRLFGSKALRSSITECVTDLEVVAGIKETKEKRPHEKKPVEAEKHEKRLTSSGNKQEAPFAVFEDEEDGDEDESTSAVGGSDSEDRNVHASLPDPTYSASTFLPSLQSGYLPALDGSDDEGELKGLFPAQKKERKNRRGQRARRKILEAKHGNKAKHIIKEREDAQKEYEERVARRAAKEAERTGANAISIAEAERNRKERREAKLRPIHGSWQVAKMQKEKMRQAKPEGSKIVFE